MLMMNRVLKVISLFLLILLLLPVLTSCNSETGNKSDLLSAIRQRGKIIAGVKYDSKPFGYIDQDRKLKGFDVDMLREIAKRLLGNEDAIEFRQVTSSNRIFSLTAGEVDLVAATMTINPRRSQIIDFSTPYFQAGQAIMVLRNSKIRGAKDLNGKKVLVVLGSTSEKNLRLMAPKAKILGFRTYTDAYSALKAGRGDALTTDDAILYGFLAKDKSFKILEQRYSKEPYGIAFRKSANTKSFQKLVNDAVKEMMMDGTLRKLRRKWIIQRGNMRGAGAYYGYELIDDDSDDADNDDDFKNAHFIKKK